MLKVGSNRPYKISAYLLLIGITTVNNRGKVIHMKKYLFLVLFVMLFTSCADDGASIDTVAPVVDPALTTDAEAAAASAAAAQAAADAAAASAAAAAAGLALDCTTTSTYYGDGDGDGYGSGSGVELTACDDFTGYADNADDCDDADANINPEGVEVLRDGIDQNCDENDGDCAVIKTLYADADGDDYGSDERSAPTLEVSVCDLDDTTVTAGFALTNTDCDDGDARQHPYAEDRIGDGLDTNCKVDQELTKYVKLTDDNADGVIDASETFIFRRGRVAATKVDNDGFPGVDVENHYIYSAGNLTEIDNINYTSGLFSKSVFSDFDTEGSNPKLEAVGNCTDATFTTCTYTFNVYTYAYDLELTDKVTSKITSFFADTVVDGIYDSAADLSTGAPNQTDIYDYTVTEGVVTAKTVDLLSDGNDAEFTYGYNTFGDVASICDDIGLTCSKFIYTKGYANILETDDFKGSISLERKKGRVKTGISTDLAGVASALKRNLYDKEGSIVSSFIDKAGDGLGEDDRDNIQKDKVVKGIPTYVDNE